MHGSRRRQSQDAGGEDAPVKSTWIEGCVADAQKRMSLNCKPPSTKCRVPPPTSSSPPNRARGSRPSLPPPTLPRQNPPKKTSQRPRKGTRLRDGRDARPLPAEREVGLPPLEGRGLRGQTVERLLHRLPPLPARHLEVARHFAAIAVQNVVLLGRLGVPEHCGATPAKHA